jgi:phage host-nuclease inhibitor protein Gam
MYKPNKKAKAAMIDAPIKKDLKNLKKEIPELKKAITSVSEANFEVNQITDKNKKRGSNEFAK